MAMKVDEVQQKLKVKEQMEKFLKKYKRMPRKEEYTLKYDLPCARTVKKYYGSKENLYRECGLEIPLSIQEVTKEDIIRSIREFNEKNGRLPLKKEFILSNNLPTIQHIQKYFEGIEEAKIASGFEVANKKREYTKQEVIKKIQEFNEAKGRLPKKEEINAKNGFPSINKFRAIFGTMKEAFEDSGFKSQSKIGLKHDPIKIEEIIVKKYKEKGRRLKFNKIDLDEDLPKHRTVCNILRQQNLLNMWEYLEKKYKLKKHVKYNKEKIDKNP